MGRSLNESIRDFKQSIAKGGITVKRDWIGWFIGVAGFLVLVWQISIPVLFPAVPPPSPYPSLSIDIGFPQPDGTMPVSFFNNGTMSLTNLNLNYSLVCEGLLTTAVYTKDSFPIEERELLVSEPKMYPVHLPFNDSEQISVLGLNGTHSNAIPIPQTFTFGCDKDNLSVDIKFDVYTSENYSICILVINKTSGSYCQPCYFTVSVDSDQHSFEKKMLILVDRHNVDLPSITLKGRIWPNSLQCLFSDAPPSNNYTYFDSINMTLFHPLAYCAFHYTEDQAWCESQGVSLT